jgi:hypothetical protein
VKLAAQQVARALGGEAIGRTYALVPGPGHDRKDRSLKIKLDPCAPGGFIVHSFAGDDWRECRDHVRDVLGIKQEQTPRWNSPEVAAGPLTEDVDSAHKLIRARHLWACRSSIDGSPAETYLREVRGYRGALPAILSFHEPGAYGHPAMIAAFGLADEPEPGILFISDNEVRGIHLTFLERDGSSKADIQPNKIMLGPSSGWPIVVAPPSDLLALAVTEGIEDALSVYQATGLGVWAAGAAGRMPALVPMVPNYIECVTIYAHRDEAGQRGAHAMADALLLRGIEVFLEGIKP